MAQQDGEKLIFVKWVQGRLICPIGSILLVTETGLSLAKQSIPDYCTSILCKDDALTQIQTKLIESNHFCPYPEAQGGA